MAMRDHVRPDGSINRIVNHEIDKVGVRGVIAGQGYESTSCWSHGLAWAVYGSVISYVHTGKPEYLDAAKRTADYFIERRQGKKCKCFKRSCTKKLVVSQTRHQS